jgi:deoxyribose-phosphate aldolase
MNVKQFLDSTYLKTANQAGISESVNQLVVQNAIQEAIDEDFKLIMIRPEYVALAKKMITSANSKVTIGTVIDFPMGNKDLDFKLVEAKLAIQNGADDLDFVLDYEAFKRGEV